MSGRLSADLATNEVLTIGSTLFLEIDIVVVERGM